MVRLTECLRSLEEQQHDGVGPNKVAMGEAATVATAETSACSTLNDSSPDLSGGLQPQQQQQSVSSPTKKKKKKKKLIMVRACDLPKNNQNHNSFSNLTSEGNMDTAQHIPRRAMSEACAAAISQVDQQKLQDAIDQWQAEHELDQKNDHTGGPQQHVKLKVSSGMTRRHQRPEEEDHHRHRSSSNSRRSRSRSRDARSSKTTETKEQAVDDAMSPPSSPPQRNRHRSRSRARSRSRGRTEREAGGNDQHKLGDPQRILERIHDRSQRQRSRSTCRTDTKQQRSQSQSRSSRGKSVQPRQDKQRQQAAENTSPHKSNGSTRRSHSLCRSSSQKGCSLGGHFQQHEPSPVSLNNDDRTVLSKDRSVENAFGLNIGMPLQPPVAAQEEEEPLSPGPASRKSAMMRAKSWNTNPVTTVTTAASNRSRCGGGGSMRILQVPKTMDDLLAEKDLVREGLLTDSDLRRLSKHGYQVVSKAAV